MAPDLVKFKVVSTTMLRSLTSKSTLIMIGLCLAPPAIWLTVSRLARAADKMSPDSVSSTYPDPDRPDPSARPILPLPKRRLRERLSPEAAEAIQYPPAPENTTPLFYYPYNLKGDSAASGAEGPSVVNRENGGELAQGGSSVRNSLGAVRNDEAHSHQIRRTSVSRPLHEPPGHLSRMPQRSGQGRHANPQPPPSTTSSADGYDSFENTNNKKKRKIPTAGETILNGTHALSDVGVLGIPSPPATSDEGSGDLSGAPPTAYYQGGGLITNGKGLSGPGRGRLIRNRQTGRSPLCQVPDPNVSLTERAAKLKSSSQYFVSPGIENQGIISNAIASAEKLSLPPGQENISLLHQQAGAKGSPASSQFTFTFDSQVPGTVSWPGSDPAPSHMAASIHGQQLSDYREQYDAVHTRTSQNGHVSSHSGAAVSQPVLNGPADGGGKGAAAAAATATPKKPRRRNGSSLLQAARQRRQQAEYQNYHHPPASEEVWICEFCEYERIFGHPPEALIRQYEIKDRRRRREEAERRRLLEKAKMKSRKGKKASKLPAKSNAAQDRNAAPAGNQTSNMSSDPSQEVQSEEFDEDDYYEEDIHDENCPIAAHNVVSVDGGGRNVGHENHIVAS